MLPKKGTLGDLYNRLSATWIWIIASMPMVYVHEMAASYRSTNPSLLSPDALSHLIAIWYSQPGEGCIAMLHKNVC